MVKFSLFHKIWGPFIAKGGSSKTLYVKGKVYVKEVSFGWVKTLMVEV